MEMDGLNEVYRLQRFVPTPQEAVGYFLRRLLTGEPLHGAEKLINHADIYACEPKDLAEQFDPVPTAVSSGDRFFFTTLRRGKNGWFARVAGAGTWMVQHTEDIFDDEGVKAGEFRKLSFKKGKGKVSTGWVMKEYRCLLPQAGVADGEMVLCRIHLAPNAPIAARQESDAYKLRRQEGADPAAAPQPAAPVTVTSSAHAHKRPAPVAAADPPCSKKTRMAIPVPVPEPELEYEDCPVWSSMPAAPVSTLPAASTEVPTAAEADDDTGDWSCSWEEIFGEEQPESTQTLPVEAEVHNIQQSASDQDLEQPTKPQDEEFGMDQLLEWAIQFDADRHARQEAELQTTKSCNHNADLQGQFFSFAPVN